MTKYITLAIGLDDKNTFLEVVRAVRRLAEKELTPIIKTRVDYDFTKSDEGSFYVLLDASARVLSASLILDAVYGLAKKLKQECIALRLWDNRTSLAGPSAFQWALNLDEFAGFPEHPEHPQQRYRLERQRAKQRYVMATYGNQAREIAKVRGQAGVDAEAASLVDEMMRSGVPVVPPPAKLEASEAGRAYAAATKTGDLDAAQKAAVAGGIQEHSVGGLYPFAIVGRGGGAAGFWWEVHNLQRGTVAALLVTNKLVPRKFDRAADACDFAAFVKDSNPYYDKMGRKVLWLDSTCF